MLNSCSSRAIDTKRKWYVVYSKPRQEEVAQTHLRLKGVEGFVPRLRFPKGSGRRKEVVPLFPNYFFVRIYLPDQFNHVLWSPGVKRFVSFGDMPTPLDNRVVEFFIQQADADGIIRAYSTLNTGQQVFIKSGPFSGAVGIIQEPPNAKERVKVLLDLLARKVRVEVPLRFVEGSWSLHPNSHGQSVRAHVS